MEPLATVMTKLPFLFRQRRRYATVALYEQRSLVTGKVIAYEVIRIQRYEQPTVFPNGHVAPPREAYPPASSWGTKGWTFARLDEAEAFLETLARKEA